MFRTPKQASLSPDFFKKERDAYDDWHRAFWRELFQNSVDAGAKDINISINNSENMGVFGQDPTKKSVTKVVFDDNGTGMSLETLNNVYFRLGESTKTGDENSTGGYGRGRLITCFANERYTILTQDNFVEGQGNLYECDSLDEAIRRKQNEIEEAQNRGSWNSAEDYERQLEDLVRFKNGYKGCRLEVDFDENEYTGYQVHKNANYGNLIRSLHHYLNQAQLPCNVTINNEPWNHFLRKGKMVRELYVKDPNSGEELLMGRVHVTKSGENKRFENTVIFRIEGAPMYERHINSDSQVIFEIDKKNHREFLTSNRDGFKAAYQRPVNDFIDELVVDNVTALKEQKKSTNYYVEGDKGDISIKVDVSKFDFDFVDTGILEEAELLAKDSSRQETSSIINSEAFRRGVGLVTPEVLTSFLTRVKNSEPNFLNFYSDEDSVRRLIDDLRYYSIEDAAKRMDPNLSKYIVSILSEQTNHYNKKNKQSFDMNNLHIKAEDPPSQIKRVMKNFDPNNWDPETGKGKTTRALFEAWTVACENAVANLLKVEPHLGPLEIRTGWYFAGTEGTYIGDKYRELRTEAVHQKLDDNKHLLLLNPVDKEGRIAFKTSSKDDLIKLINLAIHEAVHIAVGPRHNQDFAYLYTDLAGRMMPKLNEIVREIQSRMLDAKVSFENKQTSRFDY